MGQKNNNKKKTKNNNNNKNNKNKINNISNLRVVFPDLGGPMMATFIGTRGLGDA